MEAHERYIGGMWVSWHKYMGGKQSQIGSTSEVYGRCVVGTWDVHRRHMGGVWEYVGGHMGLYMEVCKNNHGGISVYGGITWEAYNRYVEGI